MSRYICWVRPPEPQIAAPVRAEVDAPSVDFARAKARRETGIDNGIVSCRLVDERSYVKPPVFVDSMAARLNRVFA